MRNEGKGGSKRNNGDLEFQSHGGGSWSRGPGQGAAEMGTRNAAGRGILSHHWQPEQHLGGLWHCLWLLTFPAILFSRWDIQRIREQRILQRLQLRMYKRKGIQESEPEVTSFFPEPDDGETWKGGVGGGGADEGVSHALVSLHSGKFAHHPLPARRRLWPALAQTDPTVSTGAEGMGLGSAGVTPSKMPCPFWV